MKIWSQSCSSMGANSVESEYEKALKRHALKIARPGTTVDFRGVDASIPGATQSRTMLDVCGWQATRNAIRAEREGYDAFIMASTRDPGYAGTREMVNIPVVFITEACLHLALTLGGRFAFLTNNAYMVQEYAQVTARYGLAERLVPGGFVGVSRPPASATGQRFKDFGLDFSQRMFMDPAPYVEKFTTAIAELASRGADVILPVPVPLSTFLVSQGVKEVNGAMVLDLYACALKTAEMMVDLNSFGVSRCKHGLTTPPPADLMPALKKLYEVKWQTE